MVIYQWELNETFDHEDDDLDEKEMVYEDAP